MVGFTQSPDDVSYPLAVPRSTSHAPGCEAQAGHALDPRVDIAEIWLRDPRQLDAVLVQARATSYGIRGLRFVTRSGVRVLLDQAAGIVIDLLVALSLIALATAAVMLAASARAEVQRRLRTIGVRQAVGESPRAHHRPALARGARLRGARGGARHGRWNARHAGAEHDPADAAQRAGARRRPGRGPCSRRRSPLPRFRCWPPPGRCGGRHRAVRSRCSRAPSSPLPRRVGRRDGAAWSAWARAWSPSDGCGSPPPRRRSPGRWHSSC